ncbi:hypothetical protein NE237_005008 [Protea cynaroides]|uniref:Uncharacterized protein n=1 Tax=Protea cynaroides TaxID=273540 RepID=A0A9Q0QU79_9MAGN|nr:hypothetical protein NE237_005008 [Protea cynaroides]
MDRRFVDPKEATANDCEGVLPTGEDVLQSSDGVTNSIETVRVSPVNPRTQSFTVSGGLQKIPETGLPSVMNTVVFSVGETRDETRQGRIRISEPRVSPIIPFWENLIWFGSQGLLGVQPPEEGLNHDRTLPAVERKSTGGQRSFAAVASGVPDLNSLSDPVVEGGITRVVVP